MLLVGDRSSAVQANPKLPLNESADKAYLSEHAAS
jgi:hypothetical protein